LAPRLAMPDWEPPLAPAVVSCSGRPAVQRRELGRAGPSNGATTPRICNACMRKAINSRARQRPPSPAMCRRPRARPRPRTVRRDRPRQCRRRAEDGGLGRVYAGPAPACVTIRRSARVASNPEKPWLPARAGTVIITFLSPSLWAAALDPPTSKQYSSCSPASRSPPGVGTEPRVSWPCPWRHPSEQILDRSARRVCPSTGIVNLLPSPTQCDILRS
jgi:hypothetical protein